MRSIPFSIAILFLSLGMRSDAPPRKPLRLEMLPRVTLWAWERREDLREADPDQFAIAYLDQTLTIDLSVHSEPRRDAIAFPRTSTRIPVVRIETTRFAVLDEEARAQAVRAILTSAEQPGIAAIQVDFDATLSQRAFYRSVLVDLRRQMPSSLPLSITALASWCSWDDWIGDLPVDEAVPMFFRMEPDRGRAPTNIDDFQIREPLCRTSVGISTRERWPAAIREKRIYVFPDKGWRNESLARLEERLR